MLGGYCGPRCPLGAHKPRGCWSLVRRSGCATAKRRPAGEVVAGADVTSILSRVSKGGRLMGPDGVETVVPARAASQRRGNQAMAAGELVGALITRVVAIVRHDPLGAAVLLGS